MVELKGISFCYDSEEKIFNDFSLRLNEGRFYGLLGKNGTGKTTFLKIISGALLVKRGEVIINKKDIKYRDLGTLQEIFLLPADFTFPQMNINKYVSIYSTFYPKFSKKILEDCFTNFDINKNIKNLQELSLGEKHKIAVSIAISSGTKILLFDEATNGMDIPTRKIFRKMLIKYIKEDQTVVLSTHVVHDIENLLTDIIILRKDKKAFISSIDDIRKRYLFGIQKYKDGALYYEPCSEGYHVICNNLNNEETEISIELLFNALTKEGGII